MANNMKSKKLNFYSRHTVISIYFSDIKHVCLENLFPASCTMRSFVHLFIKTLCSFDRIAGTAFLVMFSSQKKNLLATLSTPCPLAVLKEMHLC